jgi:hypothetical protein
LITVNVSSDCLSHGSLFNGCTAIAALVFKNNGAGLLMFRLLRGKARTQHADRAQPGPPSMHAVE